MKRALFHAVDEAAVFGIDIGLVYPFDQLLNSFGPDHYRRKSMTIVDLEPVTWCDEAIPFDESYAYCRRSFKKAVELPI